MANFNPFGGGGGGGDSLSSDQSSTLSHIAYNPVTERLEADVPVNTTLNSFYLGNQHKMSSGGENVFFTNRSSNVNFFPLWAGLKDQSIIENQGVAGAIRPTGRTYSDEMQDLELVGVADEVNITEYAGAFTPTVNESIYGIQFKVGRDLLAGSRVYYSIYRGNSNEGIKVFSQTYKIEDDIAEAELVDFWFDHPNETHAGISQYVEITFSEPDEHSVRNRIPVYAAASNSEMYYFRLRLRMFTDEEVVLRSEYGALEWHIYNVLHPAQSLHNREGATLQTRLEEDIIWDIT